MPKKLCFLLYAIGLLSCGHSQTAAESEHVKRLFTQARQMWNRTSSVTTKQGLSRAYSLYLDVIGTDSIAETPYLSDAVFELSELVEEAQTRFPSTFKQTLSRGVQVGKAQTLPFYDSFDLLQAAAELGHPDAQHKLGTFYSTGVSPLGLVPVDAGRALFLEYMSALSGNPEANMVMGFRYLFGIGVPENCQKAVVHYEYAANYAVNQINQRGYPFYVEKAKLVDVERDSGKKQRDADPELLDYYRNLADDGDSYASLALGNMYLTGSRLNRQDYPSAAKYFKVAADGGNAAAAAQLGYLLAQGLGGDVGKKLPDEKVVEYIRFAANRGDVIGVLGLAYVNLLGIGLERNETKAKDLFSKIANKNADASFYLAEMIISGAGADTEHVSSHRQGFADHRTGGLMNNHHHQQHHHDHKHAASAADLAQAAKCYAVAAQRGHVISLHRLAHMSKAGIGVAAQCTSAASGFKAVAERGDWSSDLALAHRMYDRGNKLDALKLFSRLAAMGIEMAQANAAFLLSKSGGPPVLARRGLRTDKQSAQPGILAGYQASLPPLVTARFLRSAGLTSGDGSSRPSAALAVLEDVQWAELRAVQSAGGLPFNSASASISATSSSYDSGSMQAPTVASTLTISTHRQASEQRALFMYGLSAGQGVAESYLRMGDFFYYGLGGLRGDKAEAAFYYQIAADLRHTHAMFNLGVMHELGDGVAQDLHLSKRFYDQAAEFDAEARLPRSVALALLQWHRFLYSTLGQETVDHYTRVLVPAALGKFVMALETVGEWAASPLDLIRLAMASLAHPSTPLSPISRSDVDVGAEVSGSDGYPANLIGSNTGASGGSGTGNSGESESTGIGSSPFGASLLLSLVSPAVRAWYSAGIALTWVHELLLAAYGMLLQAFVRLLRLVILHSSGFLGGGNASGGVSSALDAAVSRAEEDLFDMYLTIFLATALLYLSAWRLRRRRGVRPARRIGLNRRR